MLTVESDPIGISPIFGLGKLQSLVVCVMMYELRVLIDEQLHRHGAIVFIPLIVFPAKAREYILPALVVTTITKKIVDGFVPNFYQKVPIGGNGTPSSCFVTIGRVIWK